VAHDDAADSVANSTAKRLADSTAKRVAYGCTGKVGDGTYRVVDGLAEPAADQDADGVTDGAYRDRIAYGAYRVDNCACADQLWRAERSAVLGANEYADAAAGAVGLVANGDPGPSERRLDCSAGDQALCRHHHRRGFLRLGGRGRLDGGATMRRAAARQAGSGGRVLGPGNGFLAQTVS
jgi:hypothetical protein